VDQILEQQQITLSPKDVAEFDLYDFQSIFGTDPYGRTQDEDELFKTSPYGAGNIRKAEGGIINYDEPEDELDRLLKALGVNL
jgi:hypothetical protein